MKYCRFRHQGVVTWGSIEDGQVHPLSGPPWEGHGRTGLAHLPLSSVELLAPSQPTKVVAVGLNYRSHAEEMGKPIPKEPLLFIKPPSAVNGPGAPIFLPPDSGEVHHEAELGIVVGKTLRRASESQAKEAIFGVTAFNDVTARDIQKREVQYTRAKSYDSFACFGPWLVLASQLDIENLDIACRVNGQVRQKGRTSDFIVPPARLLAFISSVMTLCPGDVVTTGTPSGVGPIRAGDRVEVEIEGIGTLVNPVEVARE